MSKMNNKRAAACKAASKNFRRQTSPAEASAKVGCVRHSAAKEACVRHSAAKAGKIRAVAQWTLTRSCAPQLTPEGHFSRR